MYRTETHTRTFSYHPILQGTISTIIPAIGRPENMKGQIQMRTRQQNYFWLVALSMPKNQSFHISYFMIATSYLLHILQVQRSTQLYHIIIYIFFHPNQHVIKIEDALSLVHTKQGDGLSSIYSYTYTRLCAIARVPQQSGAFRVVDINI